MRLTLLLLLALTPHKALSVPLSTNVQRMSLDTANELKRAPATTSAPGIRACTYYSEDARIYDITRLEMHSKTCESDTSIDNQLPDRPEGDIYRVGEPFDVPKRN